MTTARSSYPLRLKGQLDTRLSRWLWLVKWLRVIPHVVVLVLLWMAFVALTLVAFFAILSRHFWIPEGRDHFRPASIAARARSSSVGAPRETFKTAPLAPDMPARARALRSYDQAPTRRTLATQGA